MPSRIDLANAIRALSMDAVQKANSGHPGMPMGMADIAEVLWNDFLQHNPNDPKWSNRDRFILSNGHGSMLHYSLLHLSGYDVSMDELKNFRQLHSKTPGHPEYGYAPGIETTTGPLGQGITNGVGMAIAEKTLAAQFNRDGFPIVDHHTYVFLGDGCMMEGISHEACSLAGTLGLGKLIAFWDDNEISIDGKVHGWFTDDTAARFRAYNWHVIDKVDGHDADSIKAAIEQAKKVTDKPSLICCQTVIGHGAPNAAGSHNCHGAPLGDDEIAATRKQINWPHAPFEIPEDIKQQWDQREQGATRQATWQQLFDEYQQAHPQLAAEYTRRINGQLPDNWSEHSDEYVQQCQQQGDSIATRKASLNCLNAFGPLLPEFMGGSADLTGSNLTSWQGSEAISQDNPGGNYIHYGVREFGMAAIMNGLSTHGGFIPYGGTFLVFADYARNAVRLSAMMKQRVIYVFTHDSLGLGEDGPTHQPIEHAAMLRLTPNMSVWRPCDAVETAVAWKIALEQQNGPTSLLLSRQGLPHQNRDQNTLANVERGGYILADCADTPDVILIATGSEVALAMDAAGQLQNQGTNVRVVSMPCTDRFDAQEQSYRDAVLPPSVAARVAIEAGSKDYWYKYVGHQGGIIGLDSFGESAPAKVVFEHFGFTSKHIIECVNAIREGVCA